MSTTVHGSHGCVSPWAPGAGAAPTPEAQPRGGRRGVIPGTSHGLWDGLLPSARSPAGWLGQRRGMLLDGGADCVCDVTKLNRLACTIRIYFLKSSYVKDTIL